MAINASTGASVFIGPTTDAASDSAYAALAYVEIGEVETLGDFGDTQETIKFTSLSDSRVRKLKGASDAGELNITVGHDPRDPGQIAMTAASKAKFRYAMKIVLPDAPDSNDTDTTFYFHAYVTSRKVTIGGVNDVTKRGYVAAIDTDVLEVLSKAVSGP